MHPAGALRRRPGGAFGCAPLARRIAGNFPPNLA
ncbi:hypothetical protein X976_512 [Burkholderia pseudomallei MSHR7500]|nr:hypothetical protein BPC006_I3283 [Burkholderia pseudomallei BPC006]KGS77807.1 hypothetical protein X976_512 [Burkholderia pseudomallei MSHR7500]KOT04384.1 hypothetical protein DM77_904 [Burkholderia mallei]